MIPCEVVNANNTGKPCPNPGTETAELVYPSGVSETKRCCPEHAAMVEKASTAARSILAARAAARRDQSDARAARVAAARRLERPPADPVPPVTPVEEIPTMSESKNPVEPERGQPAPKPIRSAFVVVRRCRWCESVGKFPFCSTCSDRLRSLRAWPDIGTVLDGFDAKTSPLEPVIDAWARKCEQARANRRRPNGQRSKKLVEPVEPDEDKHRAEALLAAEIENGETTDAAPAAPAEPVANVAPPKVGDRWGDLTPEQRAMVLDGSMLHFAEDRETCEKQHGSWPYEVMHDDNVIVRLGPAPSATPEPDRSGWPVLVKRSNGGYEWPTSGRSAILIHGERGYAAWFDEAYRTGGVFSTAALAADAIRARLPDEAPDRKDAPPPDPRDAEIDGLRSQVEAAGRTFAEFREKVAAAIEARLPTATDDPLLARIMDVTVDYTSATATVQQVVDALAEKGRPDGYTSSIAKSVAELRVDEYAKGRIAGGVARFERCRRDLARALGMNAPDDLALVERWDELLGRVSTLERERDEAVRSIAALRADAAELRALREALISGKGHGIGKASLDALNAAEDRMLEAVRERTRASDDQTVAVLKYATERILDSIATASDEGRPADRSLLEAVRAIATGKVPVSAE